MSMNMIRHVGLAGAFAAASSFGVTASAQTAAEPGSDAVTTAPAPDATTPVTPPASAAPVDAPGRTIPMAEDERAAVVEHTWPNRPMLVTGLVVFGATYGASVIVGAASNREADEKLYVPVVGPWLDLKDRDCDVNPCSHETLNKTLIIGSGALQGIGALSIVLSLVIPESREKPWYLIGDNRLSVTPRMGMNQAGLTAFGQF